MRSPVGDDRTPTAPDSTPVTTKHPRGMAAAFLRRGGGEELSDAATVVRPA